MGALGFQIRSRMLSHKSRNATFAYRRRHRLWSAPAVRSPDPKITFASGSVRMANAEQHFVTAAAVVAELQVTRIFGSIGNMLDPLNRIRKSAGTCPSKRTPLEPSGKQYLLSMQRGPSSNSSTIKLATYT